LNLPPQIDETYPIKSSDFFSVACFAHLGDSIFVNFVIQPYRRKIVNREFPGRIG
jgi:hypothetical protein